MNDSWEYIVYRVEWLAEIVQTDDQGYDLRSDAPIFQFPFSTRDQAVDALANKGVDVSDRGALSWRTRQPYTIARVRRAERKVLDLRRPE